MRIMKAGQQHAALKVRDLGFHTNEWVYSVIAPDEDDVPVANRRIESLQQTIVGQAERCMIFGANEYIE